ncbi:MAG: hypothetical protein ACXWZM_09900 [Solirubrobacterales bacterium]
MTSLLLRMRLRLGVGLIVAVCSVGLAACGGGERQDEDEVEGEFPVEITGAEFPAKQSLAIQTELLLSVENTGEETIPDLAVTVFTVADPDESVDEVDASAAEDEEGSADEQATDPEATVSASGEPTMAGGPFSVISQQQGLAIPSRPVWILEQGFPRLVGSEPGPPPSGELSGTGGAKAVQTNTFAFGPVEPDQTLDLVWQVTPVQEGTYTVSYRIAAGLQGNAVAVTDDGSVPEGEFIVQISDAPPQTRVNDSGEVVPVKPGDVIGQAGSSQQDDSTATTTP